MCQQSFVTLEYIIEQLIFRQVVCNTDLLFIDVNTGNPGSVHDSRVFRNSDLKARLESPDGLPPDYHLLGDSAYPLKDYLMVPFRDNGHLTRLQTNFNTLHSKTRVEVERAIGLLKGKFRRLKDFDSYYYDLLPYFIIVCCVFHNFIILNSGIHEDDIQVVEGEENENVLARENGRRSAEDKRNRLAHSLM